MNKRIVIPLSFIALDLLVVFLHLLLGENHILFNLDQELNLPTVYQATKLMLAGIAGIYINFKNLTINNRKVRIFVWCLSLALIAVGVDELFQVHENIYRVFEYIPFLNPATVVTLSYNLGFRSSLWLLYYSPLIIGGVVWLMYWIYYFYKHNKTNFLILLSVIFLVLVILTAEYFSSKGIYTKPVHDALISIEETAELIAGSLMALIIARLSLQPAHQKQRTLK